MSRDMRILEKLKSLTPLHIELTDDSQKHAHHIEHLGKAAGVGETHYNLTLVSANFESLSRIDRQRLVNDLLADEFKNGLHALQMKLMAPTEYQKK